MVRLNFDKRGKLSLAAVLVILSVSAVFLLGSSNNDFTSSSYDLTGAVAFDVYEEEINLDFEENNSFKISLSDTDKKLSMVKLTGFVVDDPYSVEEDIKIYLKDENENEYLLYSQGEEENSYEVPMQSFFTITGLIANLGNKGGNSGSKGKSSSRGSSRIFRGSSASKGRISSSGGNSGSSGGSSGNSGGNSESSGESSNSGGNSGSNSNSGGNSESSGESSGSKGNTGSSDGNNGNSNIKDTKKGMTIKESKKEDAGSVLNKKSILELVPEKVKIKLPQKVPEERLIGEIILDTLNEKESKSVSSGHRSEKGSEIEIYAEVDEKLILEKKEISYKKIGSNVKEFAEYVIIPKNLDISEFELVVEVNGVEVVLEDLTLIFE